jgi:cation transport protein ChaC
MNLIRFDAAQVSPGHVRSPSILTRALIAAGDAGKLAGKDDPDVRFDTDAERQASLDAFLKARPAGNLWIFGYGSLIWNPALISTESRVARVAGWHRSFCLSMTAGRGTADLPGLALGLDSGGACLGVAYRIAEEALATELPILWGREMLLGGYNPRWVNVIGADGAAFGKAIAFVIDKRHRLYAGDLPLAAIARRLATAAGSWGSSADYLFRTRDALRAHGIPDADLEKLSVLVQRIRSNSELAEVA